ncbi:MAG: GatB/YqeY domain-containing protein [Candidatus Krumholzibacteriota bacterium]|nr:GatB/YqeY domain-containing protein [Candidatus Krumholzibacteriota bacterium]
MEANVIAHRLQEDLKAAVKARDKARTSALRMLISALKNAELEEREALSVDQEIAVLSSYARRCRESIASFEKGGRDDLVLETNTELAIVMGYLPEQADEEEIRAEAKRIIGEIGASSPKDMGRVMGPLMKKFKGRSDGGVVRVIVGELLSGDR